MSDQQIVICPDDVFHRRTFAGVYQSYYDYDIAICAGGIHDRIGWRPKSFRLEFTVHSEGIFQVNDGYLLSRFHPSTSRPALRTSLYTGFYYWLKRHVGRGRFDTTLVVVEP